MPDFRRKRLISPIARALGLMSKRKLALKLPLVILSWLCMATFSSEINAQENNRSSMEIVVLYDVPPNSEQTKILYEVFSWGREATGEYLYYGEIDKEAVKSDGTGDLTLANYSGSVEVSFEEDFLAYAKFEVEDLAPQLPVVPSPPGRVKLTPSELSKSDMWKGQWLVERSGRHAIFLYNDDPYTGTVILRLYSILDRRVKEISVSARGDDISVSEMWSRFSTLVTRYNEIPMRRFTGAIRE